MGTIENVSLVFRSNWTWGVVFLAFAGAVALCIFWGRPTREAVSKRLFAVLTAIQVIAVLMMVLWLVNPRLRYEKNSEERGGLAVLIDSSISMAKKDGLSGQSRYDTARRILAVPDSELRTALEKRHDLHYFTFDTGLHEYEAGEVPKQANEAGLSTHMVGALASLAGEVRTRRLQGVIVATDGGENGSGDLRRTLRDLRVPVYTLGLGKKVQPTDKWKNVAILRVESPTRVNLNQEFEVKVHVRQENLEGSQLPVEIVRGGKSLVSETFTLGHAPRQTFSLKLTPSERGTQTFTANLGAPREDQLAADNQMDFTVLVSRQTIKVLYVEGTLRFVYKFIRRALEREESIDFESVIQTGPGRLTQQGKSKLQLRGGLPANYEDLKKFDVVMLGDFPRTILDDNAIRLLDRYVKEDKGGLLILGGKELLASGEYDGTQLEDLMPVRLRARAFTPKRSQKPYRVELTGLGRSSGSLAGLENEIPKFPVRLIYPVASVKPGAEVWLRVTAGRDVLPVLATQRYGEGRTMLLTTEDIWLMSLRESGSQAQSPMARFWIQIVQWLAQREDETGDKDPLLVAFPDKSYYQPGEDVRLWTNLRQPRRKDRKYARVQAEVRLLPSEAPGAEAPQAASAGEVVTTMKFPKADDAGKSEMSWKPPHDGHYRFILKARQEGERVEIACDVVVGRPAQELARTGLDEALLREIARESGGAYFTALSAVDIAGATERKAMTTSTIVENDLVDSPVLFAAFCVILGAGWAIRRRKNLL